ncbi:MAG: D-glycero-beta-D-manno-heptose-7-phosphate kinase [Pyrinomonadaceae bacterium]
MNLLDNIHKQKILVIGDVMLDRYWWGSVGRISPEAPVPIVQLEKMSLVPGGAANVATNVAGLSATPYLFGIKGDDAEAGMLIAALNNAGINDHSITTIAARRTTIKSRVVAHSQHVVRIDQESVDPISTADADRVLGMVADILPEMDAVIVSDYAKGFLTDHLLRKLIDDTRKRDILLVVDPKGRDFSKYKHASIITPNAREAAHASNLDMDLPDHVALSGQYLMDKLDIEALLITEGEHGMTLFEDTSSTHLDSLARDVYDVTGAGDTVIATFTAAAAAGNTFLDSAKLANAAAGLVVGKIGTSQVLKQDLADFMNAEENVAHFRARPA